MLISRLTKTVFVNKNGGISLNFPKIAYERLGKNYIFDLHDDKIVMYPIENLGKFDTK